ncbi:Uncharacterised protein [Mycobacteroides abscessus subsp. massiliense]|nr:Uncharacterised protein [Mycobacteroides abscessus subsp. massiliense]
MCGLIPALLRPLLPTRPLNPVITDRRSLRVIDRYRAVLVQRRLIDPTLIIRHLTGHLRRLKLRSIRPIRTRPVRTTPTIRRTLRMRLGHRGRSKPAQTQPTRREHQQRNNTRHRGRLMRSISSPLPQTRKPFPPTQIGSDRPQQHRDNRRDSRQHIRTGNPHIQPRRDPGGQQHQPQTAPDQGRHQIGMPQPLRSPPLTGATVTLDKQSRIREGILGQAGDIPATGEQRRAGQHRHQHLANPQRQ